jgi:cobalamin biosynthesis Mg chelatase CobN
MAILNNMAAFLEGMSAASSSKVLQLFASMSSPSFLLANDTNHDLLQSLLEFMNAVVEHQYSSQFTQVYQSCYKADSIIANPSFIYAILRSKKRIDALRSFTLESGQEELERQRRHQKDQPNDSSLASRASSMESARSPLSISARTPTLSDVPENSDAFAIGEDEDSEEEVEPRAAPSQRTSRAQSASSSVDDAVPLQLRGMSEKARGKMPAGTPTFSRQGSTTSLNSHGASVMSPGIGFMPSVAWVCIVTQVRLVLTIYRPNHGSPTYHCIQYSSCYQSYLPI